MGAKKIKPTKLTEKYQTTIPQDVRKKLRLIKGDFVVFEIKDKSNEVIIKKATSKDLEWLNAIESTLTEWDSSSDEEAYSDL